MKKEKPIGNNEKKDDRLGIRVSSEEKRKLQELAESHHITTSKLIVDALINKKKIHNDKSCEIAKMLSELANEIAYIKNCNTDCKEDLERIESRCIDIWHTLR